MRVLAWVTQPKGISPGQRFRIEQWEPLLRQQGISIRYSPFLSREATASLYAGGRIATKAVALTRALLARVREARRLTDCDVVYVFREGSLIGPALAERILAKRGIPMVFDFDDAVWMRYKSPANSYFSYLRFPGKTVSLCQMSTEVMAGNRYLTEWALRHNPSVTLVPTTIDTDLHRPAPERQRTTPTLGWTGSYSTAPYLAMLRDVLAQLRKRHVFRFLAIGAPAFEVEGVEVETRPWRAETEIEDLWDIDIGVMPLPDAPWERGKCGLKILQYMALGLPAVASPVGVNTEIVAHGRNGLLASTPGEWLEALAGLLSDETLRRALGSAGRQTVEDGYSATKHTPRVGEVLLRAAQGGGSRQ